MKAIRVERFGGPEVLQLQEVPDPSPGSGQIVVRVKATGVNPVDTYVRAGKYPRLPALPYTPGSDAAGVVEAVGEGVQAFRAGDRVYTHGTLTGAYAEYALCDQSQAHPLPERVSFAQGACVGVPCGAAWRALIARGQARPGESVLVHGATGGVGIAAMQMARAAGLTVIGTAGSDRGKLLAAEQGAHHVAGHGDYEQIRAWTGNRGVDLILEMLANANLGDDLKMLARRGRVVVIGSRGTVEIDPRLTMTTELDIRGMSIPNATPEEMASMHAALVAALESGVLRPVVGRELPLADAAQAHEAVMGPEAHGKIILIP